MITSPHNSITLTRGVQVLFDVDGHEIKAWFSMLSGKEQVFLDGVPVSEGRNWKFASYHPVRVGEVDYRVSIQAVDLRKLEIDITLSKGDTVMERYVVKKNKVKVGILFRIGFFAAAGALGFLYALFSWSLWILIAAFLLLLVLFSTLSLLRKGPILTIEKSKES